MALSFSQGLLSSLTNPNFNLTGVGQQIGGLGGQRRQAEQEALKQQQATGGLLSAYQLGAAPGGADPAAALAAMAQGTNASPEQAQAMLANMQAGQSAAEAGRQREAATAQQKSFDAYLSSIGMGHLKGLPPAQAMDIIKQGKQKPMSESEKAQLYSKFTPDSISRWQGGQGILVPIPKDEADKISGHGQVLVDAGFAKGTPEFEEQMRLYAENVTKGELAGVDVQRPAEQVRFLSETLSKNPTFVSNEARAEKVRLASSLLPLVDQGDAESVRLLERTVSEIYNSDSRAATEIDRMLTGRGIQRNAVNWLSTAFAGDIGTETKNILKDIITTAEQFTKKERERVLKVMDSSYGSLVEPEAWKAFQNSVNVDLDLSSDAQKAIQKYRTSVEGRG